MRNLLSLTRTRVLTLKKKSYVGIYGFWIYDQISYKIKVALNLGQYLN